MAFTTESPPAQGQKFSKVVPVTGAAILQVTMDLYSSYLVHARILRIKYTKTTKNVELYRALTYNKISCRPNDHLSFL